MPRLRIGSAASIAILLAGVPVWAAGGGEGGGMSLITPRFGLMFWTALTFVLLLFLLKKFAWGPLISAIDAREQSIREDLDQAKGQRDEAAMLVDEHKQLIQAARRERAEAVTAGQQDAERVKAEIVEEGRQQREQLLRQAREQIEAETRQAKSELRSTVADLTVRAAERLLQKNLDGGTQRQLVEEYLADLERGDDGSSSTH